MLCLYLLNVAELLPDQTSEYRERALSKLDTYRRSCALKQKKPLPYALSVGSGLLLQKAVDDFTKGILTGDSLQPRFCTIQELLEGLPQKREIIYKTGEKGKPDFADIPLHFSLSHSGEYCLLGVSDRELGVDIQKVSDRNFAAILKRYGTPEAREMIHTTEDFTVWWCEMEAYGKYTGQGVFELLMNRDAEPRINPTRIKIDAPQGYFAALCINKSEC